MYLLHVVRSWTLWWLVLFGLWVVMEGNSEQMELAAGGGAAAVGATFAELARRQGLLAFAPDARLIWKALAVPSRVLYEFGLVTRVLLLVLVRLRTVQSRWVAIPFPAGSDDPVSAGRRAAAILIEDFSPNSLAVDIDCERYVGLRHDLDPTRASPTLPS
jgi:hypothetical protein